MDERLEIGLKGSEFKRALEEQFESVKKEFDLKKVDIEVLYYLSDCDCDNTPTDIYKRLKLNRGHVSQAIDDLVKRGYIIAMSDAKDRRSVHYVVTSYAKPLVHKIAVLREELDHKIFDGITEQEIAVYKKVTYKILQNIDTLR
ncbi:MAG: MarR family winged helix-turn-helix transcriptional regulator [Lachnospiraceae bacterium]